MKQTDVLIVGGGPAGSSLAFALSASGLNVCIMDKEDFPRQKTCAGWVTPAVMKMLNINLDDYKQGRVLQKIQGFRIGQIGQKLVHSSYSGEPVSYGIRRIEFDDYLLRRCGAELLLQQPFKKMQKIADGWRVNDEIESCLVIGAGGHFCPVARAIGAKGVSEQAVAAQEIEFEMSAQQQAECQLNEETPELYFTQDLMGYGWVFRKGNYLNIGLGREDKSHLSSHVNKFFMYLKKHKKIPQDIPDKFNGHAYLLYPHAKRKMINDNVLLIGDAAGLASAQSGEGIRPAVESAFLAAEVVVRCQGDYCQKNLQQYNQLIQNRFGRRQPDRELMDYLPARLKMILAGWLMKTHWFTRDVVIDKWFIQLNRQPLHISRHLS